MARPCECGVYVGPSQPWGRRLGNCMVCYLFDHSPQYHALWSGQPVPAAPRRNGLVRNCRPVRQPCVHLGKATGEPSPCKTNAKLIPTHCEIHGVCLPQGPWQSERWCGKCDDYKPRTPLPIFQARPGDLACGVVVGTYGNWTPELIRLQAAQIRHTSGPVPILIADDCSPRWEEIEAACRIADVEMWPNVERIGHTGGDLSALWKGLQWGKNRGIRYLAKLSQRFIPLKARWLQDGAADLALSGLPLATRECTGVEQWPFRTECLLLDVAAWSEVCWDLTPQRYPHTTAEHHLDQLLRTRLGGVYLPWSFLGTDRYRPSPDCLWHCSNGVRDYQAVAAIWGLAMPRDFSCDGWQREGRRYLRG